VGGSETQGNAEALMSRIDASRARSLSTEELVSVLRAIATIQYK